MAPSSAKSGNAPQVIPEEKPGLTQADGASLEDTEKQTRETSEAQGGNIDPAAQSKLVRKLDLNMVPLMFCLCESSANKSVMV